MTDAYKRKSHEHLTDLAGEYRWGDAGQFFLLIIFIIGMIIDLFYLKILNYWQDIFIWYYRFIVFIILFFIACYFSQKAHQKIFDEERKKLTVIKTDIYGKIRHPMYFGFILLFLSFVILSFSLIALVIFVIIVIFYYYLCRYEEKILIDKLGEDYRDYMKKVPMLFPKIRI